MKNNKGITLIALIVTIIVLLIVAGIAIIYLFGENGVLSKSQEAKEQYGEASAKEGLLIEISNLNIRIQSEQNRAVRLSDLKLLELEDGVEKVEIIGGESNQVGASVRYKGYEFGIDSNLKIVNIGDIKIVADVNSTIEEKSILDALKNTIFNSSGNYKIKVNAKNSEGTEETVEYSTNLIKVDGNLVLDGINSVQGSTLVSNVYEFGDNTKDVATATTYAQNTIILIVNGDLTINNGVVLTACKSPTGYGGPKGFIIYCTGKITNNGTISMTARGAKAVGENVYLYENNDSTYEYVPSVGGIGGTSVNSNTIYEGQRPGIDGEDGTIRKTGGGGSGATWHWINAGGYSGPGAAGTSYSGGAGGGGCDTRTWSPTAGAGGINGGAGGLGISNYSSGHRASGGAGNPGGSYTASGGSYGAVGANGTGGLLVIYANVIENNNTISSEGSLAGNIDLAPGGSSGGGSINIFYLDRINMGSISAAGLKRNAGGAGGDGAVTIGSISTKKFIKD